MSLPERPGSFRALLDELKRRRVPRTLLGYLIACWLVLQVADVVAPALNLPDWTLTLLVWLALAGIPLVALLSWSYELSRGRLRRDRTAGPVRAIGVGALLVLVAAVLIAGAAWGWGRLAGGGGRALTGDRIAVLPFRVAGAAPAAAYLREGVMDLLAARLGTAGGPAAADPATVLAAHAAVAGDPNGDLTGEQMLEVGSRVGAAAVVTGEVVGAPSALTVEAALRSVPDGRIRARARVSGPQDSLPVLIERLAASLLSLEAGEPEQRLPALVGTSLPSLRAYLEGRAAFRRGAYAEAADHLTRAVDLDSTFALAGYALHRTSGWAPADGERGLRIAWLHRDRLPRPDRLVVEAQAGPAFPAPSAVDERLRAWSEAVAGTRGRSEALMGLADLYFHYGSLIGLREWQDRAAHYFTEALRSDPSESAALSHLTHLVLAAGDTAAGGDLVERLARADPDSETRRYLEWFLDSRGAAPAGDSAGGALTELRLTALMYILGTMVSEGTGLEQGDRVTELLRAGAGTPQERAFVLEEVYYYRAARGQPAAARRVLQELQEVRPELADRLTIMAALYGIGAQGAAAEAAGRTAARLGAAEPPDVEDLCVLSQWRAWRRDPAASRDLAALRARARATTRAGGTGDGPATASARAAATDSAHAANCALLLDAVLAGTLQDRNVRQRIARADSALRTGPPLPRTVQAIPANLAVARLLEATGQSAAALDAAGRRVYWLPGGNHLIAESLEQEGTLAAEAGDTEAAIRAYTLYLALRADAEPELAPEVDRVRERLRRLRGEG